MARVPKALVVLDDYVDRGVIETLVTSSPLLHVQEFVDLAGRGHVHDRLGDVVIVACAEFTSDVSHYVAEATRENPDRPLLLLCSQTPNGQVTEAITAGAEDVLTIPPDGDLEAARTISGDVVVAVQKAVARRRGAPALAATASGSMICVLGLKGGSGKTLAATNLTVALAQRGARVAVVDLDLQFGDVGLALGLSPTRTLYDLVRSGGSIDAEKLEDFLAVHRSGARALLAPARPDQAAVVNADFLKDVYSLLRQMYDFVVVDTPPNFTPEVIGAVDASTDVCMVAMLDSLSLKNAKLGLETLGLMEYRGRVRMLLNRADSKVGIGHDDVIGILGRAPDVLVPSDRHITLAVNQGEPIVAMEHRSAAARSYQALAGLYWADLQQSAPRKFNQQRRFHLLRRRS
jgi:pilus assembly protein CpaE